VLGEGRDVDAPIDALAAARGDVRVRFALTNLNDRIAIEAPAVTS
jgi:hypothetical protein